AGVGRNVGARRHVDGRRGGIALALARRQRAPAGFAAEGGIELTRALAGHQRVHRAQTFERVFAVEHAALVDAAEIALDVVASERGAAEQYRYAIGEAARVQL